MEYLDGWYRHMIKQKIKKNKFNPKLEELSNRLSNISKKKSFKQQTKPLNNNHQTGFLFEVILILEFFKQPAFINKFK